eukprot:snap_masked-scaffold_8-processed-gene-7.51-mRNA-1 protein AED:1.00 eAED:1.00 QI:0/-1/0/0/-1/1/1/0/288
MDETVNEPVTRQEEVFHDLYYEICWTFKFLTEYSNYLESVNYPNEITFQRNPLGFAPQRLYAWLYYSLCLLGDVGFTLNSENCSWLIPRDDTITNQFEEMKTNLSRSREQILAIEGNDVISIGDVRFQVPNMEEVRNNFFRVDEDDVTVSYINPFISIATQCDMVAEQIFKKHDEYYQGAIELKSVTKLDTFHVTEVIRNQLMQRIESSLNKVVSCLKYLVLENPQQPREELETLTNYFHPQVASFLKMSKKNFDNFRHIVTNENPQLEQSLWLEVLEFKIFMLKTRA